jgi:transglutaminase-like putative cysteine protease
MHRRTFLAAAAGASFAGCPDLWASDTRAASEPAFTWRRFQVVTRVDLRAAPAPAILWLPLAQTAARYQVALETAWQGNGQIEVVRDDTYGAQMLRVTWNDGAVPKQVEVTQTVATCDRVALASVPLSEAERRLWTAGTDSAPTDGIVRATADRIIAGLPEPRARLRAIYDWVVDTTWRNPETPGCGLGDIKAMLESGNLAGKCADINGLMTGLARAAGFPARDVYGIRVADSRRFGSLGASGVITKAQHCRSEVYLEDAGWFPVDPADVRKVVLERKLAVDSPEIRALRDRLFGAWEMNWVGYNSATDIVLPGAAESQKPNFAFLMYPCAFTATGQPDCLDPAHYRYEITSREVTA